MENVMTKQKLPTMNVQLVNNQPTTKIDFLMSDGSAHSLVCTAADLSVLTTAMGAARAKMLDGTPVPSLLGVQVAPVHNPHWLVQHEPSTGGTAVFFQHPAFGPVAFVIPRHELQALATALGSHAQAHALNALPHLGRVIN
jgi:hypothetical protein